MKRGVGKGENETPESQNQKVTYYRIYEEYKEGILTHMLYLHLKPGARTEQPIEIDEACKYLGITKKVLNKLVQDDLLKKYKIEGSKSYVFFLSEIKVAIKEASKSK